MDQRIFHGAVSPDDFARALVSEFNRGNLQAQRFDRGELVYVQIATRDFAPSGGQTALTVSLQQVEDGVVIKIGKQAWLGVAASLGKTAFSVLRSPWALLERLDDLAQDIENLRLSEQVWEIIESTAKAKGAAFELSERLRRIVCEYCLVANPVGEPSCIACGAPLGKSQPKTCPYCGFVIKPSETVCSNCRRQI